MINTTVCYDIKKQQSTSDYTYDLDQIKATGVPIYWKITETIDKPGNKKLDVDALKLEVLSGIAESKIRRVL